MKFKYAMILKIRFFQVLRWTGLCVVLSFGFNTTAEINKNECQLCHLQKSIKYVPKKRTLERYHQKFSLTHGKTELSCNHCHDKNNHNYLKENTPFKAAEAVCKRCHFPQHQEWTAGLHGKQNGGWKNKGEKWHCIECHSPHSVSFKKMKASPPPHGHGEKEEAHK